MQRMDIENPPPPPYRRVTADRFFEQAHGHRPKLTLYRISVLAFAIVFGLSKAKLAYEGQSTALNTVDWLNGVCAFLVLYWLGIYEKYATHMATWFFDEDVVDYAWERMTGQPIQQAQIRQRQD